MPQDRRIRLSIQAVSDLEGDIRGSDVLTSGGGGTAGGTRFNPRYRFMATR